MLSIPDNITRAIITPSDQVYSMLDQMKEILGKVITAQEATNGFFQDVVIAERDIRKFSEAARAVVEQARAIADRTIAIADQAQNTKEICLEAKNICLKSIEELNKHSSWNSVCEFTATATNSIWNTIQSFFTNEITLTAEIGISLIAASSAINDYRHGNMNWKRHAVAAGISGLLAVTSYCMLKKRA